MLKQEELDNIEAYEALCELKCKPSGDHSHIISVSINNTPLSYNDFGEKYDTEPESAEPYGCGNMQFIPFEDVKKSTLEKYNLNEKEYRKVQEKLKEVLSFGYCGWCV